MSDKIQNTSAVKDEALALLIHELLKKHASKWIISGEEFNAESDLGRALIAVAADLNQSVIKPAGERAAAYMLRNYHKALYDALPSGDVNAWDMVQAVNTHLENVAMAIRTLEAQSADVVEEESL